MASAPIFLPATSATDLHDDIATQTSSALARLDTALRATGSSLADAVAVTVYLREASDFADMNDAYRQAWTTSPPTRTTVVTEPLTPDALVKISLVAVPSGTERTIIHPVHWMHSPNPYSYAIRSGDLVFLSGLIARRGRDNSVVAGDVATQTRAVLENAGEVLAAAGLSHHQIAAARVFLPDLADFPEMNRAYGEFFRDAPPARATVGARLTSSASKVEMTFIAATAGRVVVEDGGERYPNVSTAIQAGSTLCVAGLLGAAAETRGNPAQQTRRALHRLDAVLDTAGYARSDVRELLVYVTDVRAAAAAREESARHFDGARPAITLARAALAVPDGLVEIMATAVRE